MTQNKSKRKSLNYNKMKILNILLLVIGFWSSTQMFSQNYTQEFNSLYNHYEFKDANGNVVSTKKWNSLYNRWEVNFNNNSTSTRKYQEYVQPYDFNLMYRILENKNRQYERNVRLAQEQQNQKEQFIRLLKTIKRNDEFSEKLNKKIGLAINLYEMLDDNLALFGNSFIEFVKIKKEIEDNNPKNILNEYNNNIDYTTAIKLNNKIDDNINYLLSNFKTIKITIEQFQNNPNKIIKSDLISIGRLDYVWNNVTQKYEKSNEYPHCLSKFSFNENSLTFYKCDANGKIRNYLFYDGFENGHHIFYDSYNQLIALNKNLTKLEFYYEPIFMKGGGVRYLKFSRYNFKK